MGKKIKVSGNEPVCENNVFLEGELNEEIERNIVSVRELFQYADKYDMLLMIVGGIAAVAVGAALPAFSFVFGKLIDNLFRQTNPEKATAKSALIMVYVGIAVVVFASLYVGCWMITAARQVAVIRMKYLESLLRQDISWHDAHSAGYLSARMTGDIIVLQNGINDKLGQGIMNLSMGVLGFVFGFFFSWELALVMLGMMPFIAIMGAIMGRIMSNMANGARKHFSLAGSLATEIMENVRTVQTFGREEHELGRFHKAVLCAQEINIKKELTSSLAAGGTMAIVFVTYTIAFFFASYLVQWNRRTVGDIVACFLSVLMGSFGFGYISSSWSAFLESRSVARHFFDTINCTPEIDANCVSLPVRGFNDSIELRNVHFLYPRRPDMKLFSGLSLVIRRGQKVAFSGASGCGKSSIIGLIQRFYDPCDGEILVDGVELNRLSLREWRDQIGMVSQEPVLFSGTIIDNVRMGKTDATEEEVIEACKQANIHDTIMSLPDKYNTTVGACGSQLSGGQRQRIAIARAIVRRPAILILDEATSALDRQSEIEVQAALDRLMEKGCMTVIIVAHRLATIRNVDCIYYLSYDGVLGSRIEEVGTFDNLLEKGGKFAAMAMSQGIYSKSVSEPSGLLTKNNVDEFNNCVDEVQLFQSDYEQLRAERQKIPYDELANWEVKQTKVGMTRLMSLAKDKIMYICLANLGSIITGGAAPASGILFGRILSVLGQYGIDKDEKTLRNDTNSCAPLFLVMAAGTMLGWVLQFFYGYTGEHLTTRLRVLLFRQILRQDMSFFDIPGRDAAGLSGILSGDCEAVHQLLGPSIGFKLQTLCTVLVGLIIGFIYQWKLAFVALVCFPLVAVANLAQQLLAMGVTQKKESSNAVDALVTEALSNMRTVASFNLNSNIFAMYRENVRHLLPKEMVRNSMIASCYGFSQFMFYGAFALCFWYGGKLIGLGEAKFGDVLTTCMAVIMGAMGAGEAGGFASRTTHAKAAARRVFSIIDRVPDVDICRGGKMVVACDGFDIAFRNVKFIYPARPNHLVLTSMSSDFFCGTSNGIMGQTGCGKSTIIQILARFYDSCGGKITINNQDIRELDIASWRENISIVMQEPDLFNGTVRENICYSRPDASDEEVEEAARFACIHDEIVRWPCGYDTDVGYRGRAMSGGQKQRLALARGFLRRAPILLLDEATTALDNVTEAKVQKGIDEYRKKYNVTVISIAHRLTTICCYDNIILLENGRVVECGSHEQLMYLNGEYKKRWELYTNSVV